METFATDIYGGLLCVVLCEICQNIVIWIFVYIAQLLYYKNISKLAIFI